MTCNVAFIGLGVMGYPMAGYISKAGHNVTVFNRTTSKAEKWISEYKGKMASSPKDAAEGADFIFTCVGNDDDLRQVTLGENGLFNSAKKGSIYIDNSTVSAEISRELYQTAEDKGFSFLGPTGSGKELIARKIHNKSNRSENPFIILNGALLDVKKYEQELFGEELNDGSISYGALEKASGGFLLIDEVTEIPLETQSKILRIVIDQKFKRINGNHDIKVDVRIVCSTSKDIKKEILHGNFREDLFHRLNVFNINIDPLSKRVEDIPLLIDYFIKKICKNYNRKEFNITNNSYLLGYNWPGNVRELRNLIERIAILETGDDNEKILEIIKESLSISSEEIFSITENLSVPLREARENFEKEYLTTQIKKFGGNISKTAKFVGMERSALHRKLKLLGVKDLN